jgi:hypothetical protein
LGLRLGLTVSQDSTSLTNFSYLTQTKILDQQVQPTPGTECSAETGNSKNVTCTSTLANDVEALNHVAVCEASGTASAHIRFENMKVLCIAYPVGDDDNDEPEIVTYVFPNEVICIPVGDACEPHSNELFCSQWDDVWANIIQKILDENELVENATCGPATESPICSIVKFNNTFTTDTDNVSDSILVPAPSPSTNNEDVPTMTTTTTTSSSNNVDDGDNGGSGLSGGAIAGIVFAVALVAIVSILLIGLYVRRQRNDDHDKSFSILSQWQDDGRTTNSSSSPTGRGSNNLPAGVFSMLDQESQPHDNDTTSTNKPRKVNNAGEGFVDEPSETADHDDDDEEDDEDDSDDSSSLSLSSSTANNGGELL